MRVLRSWGIEIVLGLVIAGCIAATVWALPQAATSPVGPVYVVPVKVLEIKDGDTIAADIVLPWDVTLRAQSIRESSYDAWEASKRRQSAAVGGEVSDAEVAKGRVATGMLRVLLEKGEVFAEPSRKEKSFGERDVYGRLLAKLWVFSDEGKWLDVGAEMKRRGQVRK